ncbi:hypothetical protein Slin15195_G129200 [Septoria linicola]|uniref:Uncharacterized protein n=1 Tax=Septoria linicola TaxID=215465 RepID=A0A9Q9B9N3_9PEZI|nr:hypothetical protein Slin14017_G121740 [Septoria linicola]USW59601.1 hypothetical protein Slin15195_G129200 [Septoria linicola]
MAMATQYPYLTVKAYGPTIPDTNVLPAVSLVDCGDPRSRPVNLYLWQVERLVLFAEQNKPGTNVKAFIENLDTNAVNQLIDYVFPWPDKQDTPEEEYVALRDRLWAWVAEGGCDRDVAVHIQNQKSELVYPDPDDLAEMYASTPQGPALTDDAASTDPATSSHGYAYPDLQQLQSEGPNITKTMLAHTQSSASQNSPAAQAPLAPPQPAAADNAGLISHPLGGLKTPPATNAYTTPPEPAGLLHPQPYNTEERTDATSQNTSPPPQAPHTPGQWPAESWTHQHYPQHGDATPAAAPKASPPAAGVNAHHIQPAATAGTSALYGTQQQQQYDGIPGSSHSFTAPAQPRWATSLAPPGPGHQTPQPESTLQGAKWQNSGGNQAPPQSFMPARNQVTSGAHSPAGTINAGTYGNYSADAAAATFHAHPQSYKPTQQQFTPGAHSAAAGARHTQPGMQTPQRLPIGNNMATSTAAGPYQVQPGMHTPPGHGTGNHSAAHSAAAGSHSNQPGMQTPQRLPIGNNMATYTAAGPYQVQPGMHTPLGRGSGNHSAAHSGAYAAAHTATGQYQPKPNLSPRRSTSGTYGAAGPYQPQPHPSPSQSQYQTTETTSPDAIIALMNDMLAMHVTGEQ